jgi:N-carbamoyl-L-amino-acid hydrolase
MVQEVVEECAKQRAYSFKYLPSGAGHDARYMNSFCPSGMVFVPCHKGISHNEKEYASPESLAKGAQIIADSLLMLDEII